MDERSASGVLPSGNAPATTPAPSGEATPGPTCAPRAPAPTPLPSIRPEHQTAAYWKARAPGPGNEPLLTVAEVGRHNAALARPGGPDAAADVFAVPEPEAVRVALTRRLEWLRGKLESREWVDAAGATPPVSLFADQEPTAWVDQVRVTLAPLALRCGPTSAPLYTVPPDPRFDRNLCSTLPVQEPVRILGRWPGGFTLVQSRYAPGFLDPDAPLSPPLTAEALARWSHAPVGVAPTLLHLRSGPAETTVPAGTRLALGTEGRPLFATADALLESEPLATPLVPTARPLTRDAFLDEAFRWLGTPYGWGGAAGGRDCSQFVQEVLGTFGLQLPRNSGQQHLAGSWSVDLQGVKSEEERLQLLELALTHGVVLMHLPGHIMFYLGRDADGTPLALHSFAEYLEPCPGGGETLREVNLVSVSTLELGRGSARKAFIERLDRLTVFGVGPASGHDSTAPGHDPAISWRLGPELEGAVDTRPAAPVTGPCPAKNLARIYLSPAAPVAGRPVRVIAALPPAAGPVELSLVGPEGTVAAGPVHDLDGPPRGLWQRLDAPAAGEWRALLGDGDRVLACRSFQVARAARPSRERSGEDAPIYTPKGEWTAAWEDLYALFVEQLFRYPLADDLTWPNLQVLLQEPEHNLLLDHLGQGEDAALVLKPDCADLPYLLRAYFAWKLRLPFGFRSCGRGSRGRPPTCGAPSTPLVQRGGRDEPAAFQYFADRHVRTAAHSASGRTAPDDSETDLYPVPLTREALRPGTVFADPYGHLLVVAQWVPQRPGAAGILLGAEAQPDATIGRRRFWRGTFLFRPETRDVGAGFKTWRPVRIGADGDVDTSPNAALRRGGNATPFSRQQYEGTTDDFYDTVESLLNPRGLSAEAAAFALVAALEEAAVRRTKSVDNAEEARRTHPGTISMPNGAAIFQTKGPWEDFSTPSRDFRLLIALDTVSGFPEAVRRRPGNYGLPVDRPDAIERAVVAVQRRLTTLLAERQFSYVRSDGSRFTLRLADLTLREAAFEMAYNPNDCPEIRWGAPPGSAEASTCKRTAPAQQRANMARLRVWFHTRTRPVRE